MTTAEWLLQPLTLADVDALEVNLAEKYEYDSSFPWPSMVKIFHHLRESLS